MFLFCFRANIIFERDVDWVGLTASVGRLGNLSELLAPAGVMALPTGGPPPHRRGRGTAVTAG